MNVQQGDVAVIVFSIRPQNIGRIVHVAEYIGKFQENETFLFRGMSCKSLVHDHYWWVEADDLSIGFGPSPRAYIADSWLRRIDPDNTHTTHARELELELDLDLVA